MTPHEPTGDNPNIDQPTIAIPTAEEIYKSRLHDLKEIESTISNIEGSSLTLSDKLTRLGQLGLSIDKAVEMQRNETDYAYNDRLISNQVAASAKTAEATLKIAKQIAAEAQPGTKKV